jgi:hypothetical protein
MTFTWHGPVVPPSVRRASRKFTQTQCLAGLGHFEDEHFAVARSRRELDLSQAKNQHASRCLALHEQDRASGIGAQMAGRAEGFQTSGDSPQNQLSLLNLQVTQFSIISSPYGVFIVATTLLTSVIPLPSAGTACPHRRSHLPEFEPANSPLAPVRRPRSAQSVLATSGN